MIQTGRVSASSRNVLRVSQTDFNIIRFWQRLGARSSGDPVVRVAQRGTGSRLPYHEGNVTQHRRPSAMHPVAAGVGVFQESN